MDEGIVDSLRTEIAKRDRTFELMVEALRRIDGSARLDRIEGRVSISSDALNWLRNTVLMIQKTGHQL